MKRAALSQKEMLHIPYRGGTLYGVSQQLYKGWMQRISGCGPTTASNQFAYLALTQPRLRSLYHGAPMCGAT